MSYRDDYRGASRDFWWTLPRAMLAVFAVVVAVFLLMVAVTPLTIGFGWFSGEAGLRSFEHARQTYAEAFDDTEAMAANARQACQFAASVKSARDAGDAATATQRETQLLAVENNYERVRAEYQAYMRDHFRGGVLRPKQLPLPAPSLQRRMAALRASGVPCPAAA